MWTVVASKQATYLPLAQGTKVAPSGLLLSFRIRPGGSFKLGKSAFTRALQMMSFTAKWRAALPVDRLQTSPWWPPGSAISPHWHWCRLEQSSKPESETNCQEWPRCSSPVRTRPQKLSGASPQSRAITPDQALPG